MSREKVLIKNTIIYAIGNFGSQFLSFLLIPLYTSYLDLSDYGYFDLVSTTIALIIPLITFQLNDGLYRYLLEAKSSEEKTKYITNSIIIIIKNLVIFNICYIIFIQFKSFRYQYIILAQLNFNIIYGLYAQISRGLKENTIYAITGVNSTFITLILNIFFITVMKYSIGGLIISNIISSIVNILYLEYKIKIHRYIKFNMINKVIMKNLIGYSMPLIPNVICWWFMNTVDRYFLTINSGMQANGIYAISNKFPSLLIMVNSIFYLAWQESAISEYKSKDKNEFYSKMFNLLLVLQFTTVIILLAFTKVVMKYMVDDAYFSAWMFIPFLYFGAIFTAFSSFYGTGYLSSKETMGAFYTSISGAIINILLNIILIPIMGIQGASFSTMISILIMWLTRVWQTKRYFKIDICKRKFISLFLISIIYTIFYYLNIKVINYFMMISSLIIFIIYNKEFINAIINGARKANFIKKSTS